MMGLGGCPFGLASLATGASVLTDDAESSLSDSDEESLDSLSEEPSDDSCDS